MIEFFHGAKVDRRNSKSETLKPKQIRIIKNLKFKRSAIYFNAEALRTLRIAEMKLTFLPYLTLSGCFRKLRTEAQECEKAQLR